MNFLHQELDAGSEDVLEVLLDHSANVQLLDPANYENYRAGRAFRYHGGYAERTPFRIRPPYHGHWHLVIAVEVEVVIPEADPSEPCYESETVALLREIESHAHQGDIDWLKQRGKVYAALDAA